MISQVCKSHRFDGVGVSVKHIEMFVSILYYDFNTILRNITAFTVSGFATYTQLLPMFPVQNKLQRCNV